MGGPGICRVGCTSGLSCSGGFFPLGMGRPGICRVGCTNGLSYSGGFFFPLGMDVKKMRKCLVINFGVKK